MKLNKSNYNREIIYTIGKIYISFYSKMLFIKQINSFKTIIYTIYILKLFIIDIYTEMYIDCLYNTLKIFKSFLLM